MTRNNKRKTAADTEKTKCTRCDQYFDLRGIYAHRQKCGQWGYQFTYPSASTVLKVLAVLLLAQNPLKWFFTVFKLVIFGTTNIIEKGAQKITTGITSAYNEVETIFSDDRTALTKIGEITDAGYGQAKSWAGNLLCVFYPNTPHPYHGECLNAREYAVFHYADTHFSSQTTSTDIEGYRGTVRLMTEAVLTPYYP